MALVEVSDRYFLETWDRYDETGRRALVAQQMELLKRVCLRNDRYVDDDMRHLP
jgi:hypothetical protein